MSTEEEQALMTKIKAECGEYIREAVADTPYPEAFLAALAANESGGNAAAARFEPKVFYELAFVLIGRVQNFGALDTAKLSSWAQQFEQDSQTVLGLVNLASSWGPTQIMGYQALAGGYPLSDLPQLAKHFPRAVAILEAFRNEFKLTAAATPEFYESLFRCWNGGNPTAATADPNYVPNGLARMEIYEQLP